MYQGKISNDRNKTLGSKVTKILRQVNIDLAGPLQLLAKDGYKYAINFIGAYSGLTMFIFPKTQVRHFACENKVSGWHHRLRSCKMFMHKQQNGVHFSTFPTVTCT